MILYFNGTVKFALFLDGKYYGIFEKTPLAFDIRRNGLYVLAKPLDNKYREISVVIDSENPTPYTGVENCFITDLKGAFFISFLFPVFCTEYKVISQQKERDYVATVHSDNGYKLTVETPDGFFAESLPFCVDFAEITCNTFSGEKFLCLTFNRENKKTLEILTLSSGINKVFFDEIYDYSLSERLSITQNNTFLRCKVKSEWQYFPDGFVKTTATAVYYSRQYVYDNRHLSLCFLESLRLKTEVDSYCTENIFNSLDNLSEYLGDYVGVILPPPFIKGAHAGLIYKQESNRFYAKYLKAEFNGDRISNLEIMDK